MNEEAMSRLDDFIKSLSKEERTIELNYLNDYITKKLKEKQPSI